MAGFLYLRRGEREKAVKHLKSLISSNSLLADTWIWLTAATKEPAKREEYLEIALRLEPAHPLARDALSISHGEISESHNISLAAFCPSR